jgi:hypothetical protein
MMQFWMYGYGPAHWLWFIVVIAVVIYPAGRILSRIGFSPLWKQLDDLPNGARDPKWSDGTLDSRAAQ